MKRLSYPILLISMLFATLLGACGPEPAPNGSAQDGGPSAQPGASPSAAFVAVSPTAGPTELATESIEIVTARTPVPTPDLAASTQTELDQVALANPRPLQLPEELGQAPLGLITWSPDSKHFLADAFSDESIWVGQAGYSLTDLYLGDVTSDKVSLVLHNAGWPAWSRDGHTIYYLAIRSSDQDVQYDLYRRSLADEESQLVFTDVGDPGTQPAVSETADGRLVSLNRDYQTVLIDQGTITLIASLVNLPTTSITGENFSLAPDGATLAVLSQSHPIYIVDLAKPALVATVDAAVPFFNNVAWSGDSSQLAYATPEGLFVYDLPTRSARSVVTRNDLGLPSGDPTVSFGLPIWSPDEQTILFAASTQDWTRTSKLSRNAAYQFASTANGDHWKALSETLLNLAPNKAQAITPQREPETGRELPFLIDLTWK